MIPPVANILQKKLKNKKKETARYHNGPFNIMNKQKLINTRFGTLSITTHSPFRCR